MSGPPRLKPRLAGIPAELKATDRWVLWRSEDRGGKPAKVPYSAKTRRHASVKMRDCKKSEYREAVYAAPWLARRLGVPLDELAGVLSRLARQGLLETFHRDWFDDGYLIGVRWLEAA